MEGRSVLVVESDVEPQAHLPLLLHQMGYTPVVVRSADDALLASQQRRFACTFVDAKYQGYNGDGLLGQLRLRGDESGPLIVVSADGEAQHPAADFVLSKSCERDELERTLQRVIARRARPLRPPTSVEPDASTRLDVEMALWRSPNMRAVKKVIEQAAQIDITVLVTGETGVGKDVVARAIHRLSSRQTWPFVKVNCAAVPRDLLESELFGHERGAFTGAHQLKIGKFEAANGGSIFLDEIGDLHPGLQGKLLHVLQDGEFSRVGGKSTIKVNVRVVAATNQDLEAAVEAGRFRQDLYYRLNVIQIHVPPLRERIEEIPDLIRYFVDRYSTLYRRDGFSVPPRIMERLIAHSYQGNVRELENIVKRMIVLNDPHLTRTTLSRVKGETDNGDAVAIKEPQAIDLKDIVREAALAAERRAIASVLEQTRWNRVKAAKLLNISYRALLYKIKNVGLERDRTFPRPRP